MRQRTGDMWSVYNDVDLFLITTNSFIKKNGALVMGAGIARQARDRFKGLDLALGRRIEHLGTYGLLVSERFPQAKLGVFQVKTHFKDEADLSLIYNSTEMLKYFCEINPDISVSLNYPGIGNGKLTKSEVYPIIKSLPDNVTVWEYRSNSFGYDVYDDMTQEAEEDWMDGHPLDYGDR